MNVPKIYSASLYQNSIRKQLLAMSSADALKEVQTIFLQKNDRLIEDKWALALMNDDEVIIHIDLGYIVEDRKSEEHMFIIRMPRTRTCVIYSAVVLGVLMILGKLFC